MNREEALVSIRRASPFRTICEVHREIFDATNSLNEKDKKAIQELVIEAFIMAKKMDAKLKEYKADWDEGLYQANTDRRQDKLNRSTA